MSDELAVVIIFSVIVIGALIAALMMTRKDHATVLNAIIQQHTESEREWNRERQLLLDRIQAPTFSEMKHQEIKKIRAENGEKPAQPIIPL